MITKLVSFLGKFLVTAGVASGSVLSYKWASPRIEGQEEEIKEVAIQEEEEEEIEVPPLPRSVLEKEPEPEEVVVITNHVSEDLQTWSLRNQCVRTLWRFTGGASADILTCTTEKEGETKEYRFFLSKQLERYGKGSDFRRRLSDQTKWHAAFSKDKDNKNYLKVYDSLNRLRIAESLEEIKIGSQEKEVKNLYRIRWSESFEKSESSKKEELLKSLRDKAKELLGLNVSSSRT